MRLRLTLVPLAVVLATTGPARADGIPAGKTWSCFSAALPNATGDKLGECAREESTCTTMRSAFALAMPAYEVSDCQTQKRASVVTYYDVMHDDTRVRALPSTSVCEGVRKGLAADKDAQKVSACQVVADSAFQFDTAVLPVGNYWYCSAGTKSNARNSCGRSLAECNEVVHEGDPPCEKEQESAFALAWSPNDDTVGRDFLLATGRDGHGLGVFPNKAECLAFRSAEGDTVGLSQCTAVGAKDHPDVDAGALPEGKGWTCMGLAGTLQTADTCFRDPADCQSAYDKAKQARMSVRACQASSKAYVFTAGYGFGAFLALDECKYAADQGADTSRCVSRP